MEVQGKRNEVVQTQYDKHLQSCGWEGYISLACSQLGVASSI